MKVEKWIKNNTENLNGKLVAITGASGDLGKEVCKMLVSLGANLLLINRSEPKTQLLIKELKAINSTSKIDKIIVDFESFSSVKEAVDKMVDYSIDIFIANAGAYKIERRVSDLGYDNVFQINFVSQYYMIRRIIEKLSVEKIVVVSSIAYNYSKIDIEDIDFKNNKYCNKVYGNSKRFLTFSTFELFKNIENIKLSIVHPGISYTNITSHYPKLVFKLIKYPMKVIFHKPRKASLSIIKGVFDSCELNEWIGPKYFNVWGYPDKKKIKHCSNKESGEIGEVSDKIYLDTK